MAASFDTVHHRLLLQCVRRRVRDRRFVDLLWRILKAGHIDRGLFTASSEGVPQGGVLSPLLSNITLHEFDAWLEAKYLNKKVRKDRWAWNFGIQQGRPITVRENRQGYRQMLAWMRSFGELQRIEIESTGSYGAGLLRFMQQAKVAVLEVTTPDKQDRRRRGKNADLDAQNAAHAAFAGQRTVTPRSRDGMIESLRILMACRKTAVSARRVALQMIHNTIVCAPDGLRDQLRSLTRMQLVRTLASWRPDLTAYRDLDSAYRIGLKSLARRYLELHDEIADLDVMIAAIVDELAANLIARNSIGHIGAAQLLLTAGDNPERLRSEASFASLCGVSPVPASSGKTVRHRLNRGGDRAANSALHIIAIGRLRTDQRTKDYIARRIAEGHSKLDAIRALKRYLAREVFTLITQRRKEINATRIAA